MSRRSFDRAVFFLNCPLVKGVTNITPERIPRNFKTQLQPVVVLHARPPNNCMANRTGVLREPFWIQVHPEL
jgi:hypothetical protein